VQAQEGQVEEGIAQMWQSMADKRSIGTRGQIPHSLASLAEAYGEAGQIEEGLTVLSEALEVAQSTGERYYEAEIHRLKGELLLMQGEPEAQVEACFRQAIHVAQQQQAKSLELRAAKSLSRLWQKQGRKEEARQLLQEIYDWFLIRLTCRRPRCSSKNHHQIKSLSGNRQLSARSSIPLRKAVKGRLFTAKPMDKCHKCLLLLGFPLIKGGLRGLCFSYAKTQRLCGFNRLVHHTGWPGLE
jgi:tetratricopeptide (TPR) repeat protein